jgi:hypothetical protein
MCREGGSSLNGAGGGGFLTRARSLAGEDRARAGIERAKEEVERASERIRVGKRTRRKTGCQGHSDFFLSFMSSVGEEIVSLHSLIYGCEMENDSCWRQPNAPPRSIVLATRSNTPVLASPTDIISLLDTCIFLCRIYPVALRNMNRAGQGRI